MTLRIGLVKVGAMGDVLMTTPLVRQLRGHFPDAMIHYHAGEPSRGVLDGNPHINELFSFDPSIFYEGKGKEVWTWMRAMAARRYDHLYILDKKLPYALACKMISPRRSFGFARSPLHRLLLDNAVSYGPVRHEVHYYLDLPKPLFNPDYAPDACRLQFGPTLPSVESIPSATKLPSGPFDVWVNSGGLNAKETGGARRLPTQLFQRLVGHHAREIPIVLLGGTNDALFYERSLPSKTAVNLAGKLKLAESAKIMQLARCVFTTDCGAMHLAGCVQDRMVAFFGPTNPRRKLPFGKAFTAIWHDADIYDERYEVFGTPPEREFFRKPNAIFNDFAEALQKLGTAS